jgi:hypothetical protein
MQHRPKFGQALHPRRLRRDAGQRGQALRLEREGVEALRVEGQEAHQFATGTSRTPMAGPSRQGEAEIGLHDLGAGFEIAIRGGEFRASEEQRAQRRPSIRGRHSLDDHLPHREPLAAVESRPIRVRGDSDRQAAAGGGRGFSIPRSGDPSTPLARSPHRLARHPTAPAKAR